MKIQANYSANSVPGEIFSKSLSAVTRLYNIALATSGMGKDDHRKAINQYRDLQNILKVSYADILRKKAGIQGSFTDELKNIENRLDQGLISELEFMTLSKSILEKLESFDKQIHGKIHEINNEYNSQSKRIENVAIDLSSMRDPMLKKRLFFLFLMASPFLPIPFLDVIVNGLSTAFDPNVSFGQGMANLITSDQLGFMGQFFDIIELDKAVEFIFDETPIISDILYGVDQIAGTEIVQSLASVFAVPLITSPLSYLGLSLFGGTMLTDQELELSQKKAEKFKSGKKEIEDLYWKKSEEIDQIFKPLSKKAIEERFDAYEKAAKIEKILKFIGLKEYFRINDSDIDKIFLNQDNFKKIVKEDVADKDKVIGEIFKLTDSDIDIFLKKILNYEDSFYNEFFDKNKDSIYSVLQNSLPARSNQQQDLENFKQLMQDLSLDKQTQFFDSFDQTAIASANNFAISDSANSRNRDPLFNKFKDNFADHLQREKLKAEFDRYLIDNEDANGYRDGYAQIKDLFLKVFSNDIHRNAQHRDIPKDAAPEVSKDSMDPVKFADPTESPSADVEKAKTKILAKVDEKWRDYLDKRKSAQTPSFQNLF